MVKKKLVAGVRESAQPFFVYYIDSAAETLYGPLSGKRSTEYSTKTGQMEIVIHKKNVFFRSARTARAPPRFQSRVNTFVLSPKRK
jgi:hypothetical protein